MAKRSHRNRRPPASGLDVIVVGAGVIGLGVAWRLAQHGAHVAVFDRGRSQIEMHLRARRRQRVRLPGAGLSVDFEPAELMLTEISVKFTREAIERDLAANDMRIARWYTDPAERFALCLCAPAA